LRRWLRQTDVFCVVERRNGKSPEVITAQDAKSFHTRS